MSTENKRADWDNALQLPVNKMPLQNLSIDSENLKYYLTHEEYNILLKAVQSLIEDYTEGGGGGNPGGVDLDSKYLSKVTHDRAAGLITFLQGVKFQPTQEDANLNTGGAIKSFGINQYGIGHLRGLTLDEWLEVPELRFNRVEVSVGDFWRAAGGGKIESVEITSVDTGIITLKVEEGEMGAISESDLCLGIYHFLGDGEEPAPENSEVEIEDGKGNRAVKGFASIYFTITEILTEELVEGEMVPVPANTKFRYKLRPTNSTTFFTQHHPQPFMNFVAYGNSDDTKKHRQNSSYQTKTYERFLVNVNNWEYGDANIAAQFGDLSNISHIVGEHEGYSVYLSNVYFSGNLNQLESTTITPVLSNPNVPIKVEEGIKNLDNTSTNLQVYEGSQELKYLPGSSVDLTEGTYSVTIDTIAINHGTMTDSGTYLQMGVANDMRRDSATIIFNITGKRINGTSFETAIHQNLYVVDFGADGIEGPEGPAIVFRGAYNGTETYYGTAIRRDVVVYDGTYYITKKSLNGSFTNRPVSESAYWDSFGANFDSVATSLLLAEAANIAGFSYLGQKMISQNGYVGSTPSVNPSAIGFTPNLSLDGITGTIHARQGSIGGFNIQEDRLQSTHGTAPSIVLNGITGAGHLAGGNISWDSDGTVTFGSNVTLNWSNITDAPIIPDGVDDNYIKSVISDSYIKGTVDDSYIKGIINDEFIKATFEEAIETDFTTKITSNYITTAHINTLNLTSLGAVTSGSFSLGNGKFVVNTEGDLTASNVSLTGEINALTGSIGGFNIVDNVLTSTGSDYIELSGTVLKFYKNGVLQYDLGPGGITLKGGDATINGATTTTITLANDWQISATGNKLEFMYNGVIVASLSPDNLLVKGEITAFSTE